MYGLDLFSGIGGLTKALEGYVTPVAYCENDRYAQGVLMSRMRTRDIPWAQIADDVRNLRGSDFHCPVEIIYGGFPCQDISVAGRGEGLDGQRSGLFFEVARLIGELRPEFVFLENVAAITVRGSERVVGELCRLGYDTRWGILSASDVGANHRRERWWLLAHARHRGGGNLGPIEGRPYAPEKRCGDHDAPSGSGEQSGDVAHTDHPGRPGSGQQSNGFEPGGEDVADTEVARLERRHDQRNAKQVKPGSRKSRRPIEGSGQSKSDLGGGSDGIPPWLDGNLNGPTRENRTGEKMPNVQHSDGTETVQRPHGRPDGFSEAEALQSEMREHAHNTDEGRIQAARQNDPRDSVRSVSIREWVTRTPHQRGPNRQPSPEYSNLMRKLSHKAPPRFEKAWRNGSWESGIPRVMNGVPFRVDRLRGLGNAVVPAQAREAFERLMGLK